MRYVVDVTSTTREHESVSLDTSSRASRMLLATARALAAVQGRPYCIPDDVKGVAPHVLVHRIISSSEARLPNDADGSNSSGGPERGWCTGYSARCRRRGVGGWVVR